MAPDNLAVLGCNSFDFLSPVNSVRQTLSQYTVYTHAAAAEPVIFESDVTQLCNAMVTVFIRCWLKCC